MRTCVAATAAGRPASDSLDGSEAGRVGAEYQADRLSEYRNNLVTGDRDLDSGTINELVGIQAALLHAQLELALYRAFDVASATATAQRQAQLVLIAPKSTSTH